jgi:hypothetical protein
MNIRKAFGWLLVAGACAAPWGCGNSAANVCQAKCDCEGCSDDDLEHCIAEADGDGKAAEFEGCPELFSELVACETQTGVCDGTHYETSCHDEAERLKHCLDDKH